ncbi:MAG: tail fiber protein [Bacteroidota bacterium]
MEGMIGEIRLFGGNFAPRNWAECSGQLLAIAQNTALFSIIGTIYGGDGRTTFALPDIRGRVVIGPGTGPGLPTYREGARSGTQTNTMTIFTMPQHNHAASANTSLAMGAGSAGTGTGANNSLASTSTAGDIYIASDPNQAVKLRGNPLVLTATVNNTGSGQSYNNMQPYNVARYIICLTGVFPSRN